MLTPITIQRFRESRGGFAVFPKQQRHPDLSRVAPRLKHFGEDLELDPSGELDRARRGHRAIPLAETSRADTGVEGIRNASKVTSLATDEIVVITSVEEFCTELEVDLIGDPCVLG